jgi:hypothetical protein
VIVLVVDVWIMRVRVAHRLVVMNVAMRLAGRIVRSVLMLVMLIVDVSVFVGHCLVIVFVIVPLRQVQPDADAHQSRVWSRFGRAREVAEFLASAEQQGRSRRGTTFRDEFVPRHSGVSEGIQTGLSTPARYTVGRGMRRRRF